MGKLRGRELSAVPKPKTVRNVHYLGFVRGQSCCAPGCKRERAGEAHHWGKGGTGIKPSDLETAPLCPSHHREFHWLGGLGKLSGRETLALFRAVSARLNEQWINQGQRNTF